MRCAFILLNLVLLIHDGYSAMTEKQMNATKKLVRNTCTNKAKATVEQVDAMQKGDFSQEKSALCYLHCILSTYKLLKKDNTFDWESGIAAVNANAPPSIGGPAAVSLRNCKDAVKTLDDKCVASYEIAKCIYDDNPTNYFLP